MAVSLFFMSLLAPAVLGHGYIGLAGIAGQQLSKAQKTDLGSTFFRAVSSNTGWIGSNHLNSPAITCGMATTPFNNGNESPSGAIFSAADQSAGKTLSIKVGSKLQLVVKGNPGDGWPHPFGHVATYLGFCGESATACQNFDASKAEYFKIQEEINGIQNKLRPAYDGSVDGNRWDIPIPNVKPGSYIMRYELIAFGQSSSAQGGQDQYYPFCAQLFIQGGKATTNNFSTTKFPGGYKVGNINQKTAPGPKAMAAGAAIESPESGGSSSGSGSGSGSSCSTKRARRKAKRDLKRRSEAASDKRSAAFAAHAAKRSNNHHL